MSNSRLENGAFQKAQKTLLNMEISIRCYLMLWHNSPWKITLLEDLVLANAMATIFVIEM